MAMAVLCRIWFIPGLGVELGLGLGWVSDDSLSPITPMAVTMAMTIAMAVL